MTTRLTPASLLMLACLAIFILWTPAATPSAVAKDIIDDAAIAHAHVQDDDEDDDDIEASVLFRVWVIGLDASNQSAAAATLRNTTDGGIDGGPMAVARLINALGEDALVLANDHAYVDEEGQFQIQAGMRLVESRNDGPRIMTEVGRIMQAEIEAESDDIEMSLRFEASGPEGDGIAMLSFDYEGEIPTNRTMIIARQWVSDGDDATIFFLIVRGDVVEADED